jgi:hypothetical protein
VSLEAQINELIDQYRDSVGHLIRAIKAWNWDDPVARVYRELFTPEVIFDPEFDFEELRKDHEWRVSNKIPPGYKDQRKPDGGIGDLVIWKTLLELGQQKHAHLIFITGDEKSDWWVRSDNQPLYPRCELIDEYRRSSSGKTFSAMRFSAFLELFGASEDVVAEVEREEQVPEWLIQAPSPPPRKVVLRIRSTGDKRRDALRMRRLQGLLTSYPGNDEFEFRVREGNRFYNLEFPGLRTGWNDELKAQVERLLGSNAVRLVRIEPTGTGPTSTGFTGLAETDYELPSWLTDDHDSA